MIIDAFEFARNGKTVAGEVAVATMRRLDVISHHGVLSYLARGFVGARSRPFIELKVTGSLMLRCERCLQPLPFTVDFASTLWLASSDAEADSLPIEEDSYDVVVASDQFDLDGLVEDEVLLAMPVVPKHENCPKPLEFEKPQESSPFDMLKQLKRSDAGGSGH